MSTHFRQLVLIAVTVSAPLSLPAQVVVDGEAAGPAPSAPASLSPLMQDITAVWSSHLVVVESLEQQLARAVTPAEALGLQLQIEAARTQVEVQILTIQARHARQVGRLDVVAELEAAVGQLTAPPARGVPVERPRRAD